MSRILHTSDWHLGRVSGAVPRAADHDAIISEIIQIAATTKPDLVLHTGDLFDIPRPAVEEMHRAINALRELSVFAPVVVICGNHESPKLFELFTRLLGDDSRIRFVAKVKAPENGGILTFSTQNDERIKLAPLPFVHANRIAVDNIFKDSGTWMESYADYIKDVEAILNKGLQAEATKDDVLLFAAHIHVAGASWSGSERPVHVSDAYGSTAEGIPQVSYAAFGHLHKPQDVPGHVQGRFVGSPFQMDFGEEDEEKSVVLIDASPGGRAHIQRIPLTSARKMRRIVGTMEEIKKIAPTIGKDIIKVTVQTPTYTPGLADEIHSLFKEAAIMEVIEHSADRKLAVLGRDKKEVEVEDFPTMFADFLREQGTKGASADKVLQTFSTLVAAIQDEVVPHFPEEKLLLAEGLVGNTDDDDDEVVQGK